MTGPEVVHGGRRGGSVVTVNVVERDQIADVAAAPPGQQLALIKGPDGLLRPHPIDPAAGGGAGTLDELSDVTTAGATTGQVLVRGDDGVWYPQTPTAAPAWGDAVAFSDTPPDPNTAPASAVWVELGSMTIYRKAP